MRILIIEAGDKKPGFTGYVLKQIIRWLHEGHKVTLVKGLASIEPLVGIGAMGARMPIELPLDLAIVDALNSENPSGPQIVEAFERLGIFCVGTGTLPETQQQLKAAGARVAANKSALIGAIFHRAIKLADLVADPQRVQEQLDAFGAEYKQNCKLRKRLERVALHWLRVQ